MLVHFWENKKKTEKKTTLICTNIYKERGSNKPIDWFAEIAMFPHQLISCSMQQENQKD